MRSEEGWPPTPKARGIWLRWLKPLGTLALLGAVLHTVSHRDGLDALWSNLHQVQLSWMVVAVLAQLCAVWFGVIRWRLLLRASGSEPSIGWLMRTYLEGRFVGVFTPSTAGLDVYRAVHIYRLTHDQELATRPILAEKLFGLLALGAVAAPCLAFSIPAQAQPAFIATISVLMLGSGLALAFLRKRETITWLISRCPRSTQALLSKVGALVCQEHLNLRTCTAATFMSMASHAFTAAVFVGSAHALGLDVSSFSLFTVGVVIVLATLLPISLGGIGVREGVAVLLLGTAGVPPAQAALVGMLAFLATQPPAILGGTISLLGTHTNLEHPSRSVAV